MRFLEIRLEYTFKSRPFAIIKDFPDPMPEHWVKSIPICIWPVWEWKQLMSRAVLGVCNDILDTIDFDNVNADIVGRKEWPWSSLR